MVVPTPNTDTSVVRTIEHSLIDNQDYDTVWEMYRGLRISQVVPQLLPDIFKKAELVEGDGGVGTVLHLTFSHG